MGLTALHLAALMQNDKVDSALGATAPTSAPGLRCPHLRRDCVRCVAPGEQLRLTPRGFCTLHAGCVFIIRTYVYLYLRLPYVFHIYIKSISTSTPVSIIYSYPYPHGRCRRAAEAHTQVIDPQLGAPRRRTVMGSPTPLFGMRSMEVASCDVRKR